MLRSINNERCVASPLVRPATALPVLRAWAKGAAGAFVLGLVSLGPVAAGLQEVAPSRAAVLDEAGAMDAFQRISDWLKRGEVGDVEIADPGSVRLASVVVRLDGRIVARGSADGEQGVIAAATKRAQAALEAAIPKAKDLIADGAERGTARDRLEMSVELASSYTPFTPKTFDEVDRELAPGIDGVAVRIGEKFEVVYPEFMLVMRMSPGDALASAIARAADDPGAGLRVNPKGQPADVARERDAVFYRFRPVQISHVRGVPRFLYRAGEIVRESEISTPAIREYAVQLAAYLVRQRAAGESPEGKAGLFRGAFLPATGRSESVLVGDAEQALCAWSLLRAQRLGLVPESEAKGAALAVLAWLSLPAADSTEPRSLASIASTASWIILGAEAGYAMQDGSGVLRAEWKACRERLVSLAAGMDEIPAAQRGLVSFALARAAAAEQSDVLREGARLATLQVLERTSAAQMPAEMPWLGWAVTESDAPGQALAGAPVLREFRDLCYRHQLSATDPGPERRDMSGGIMLAGNLSYPTWASARPMAFLCTMVGDSRLTSTDERAKEIGRLIPALRYLRQLAADESVARLHTDRAHSAWGVRSALWDLRQPPEATAMTLVAICEALRSLDTATTAQRGR